MGFVLGIICFGCAFSLGAWVGKRRFLRTNENGVEAFDSYGQVLKTRVLERFALFGAVMLVFVGAAFFT